MTRPRVSIGRMMAAVAILSLDCYLIRDFVGHMFRPAGDLAAGLIFSAGSIALLFSRGSGRLFNIGFLAGAVAAYVALFRLRHWPAGSTLIDTSIDRGFRLLPRALTGGLRYIIVLQDGCVVFRQTTYSLKGRLIAEAVIGLPIFSVSLSAGLLAFFSRRRDGLNSAPNSTPT